MTLTRRTRLFSTVGLAAIAAATTISASAAPENPAPAPGAVNQQHSATYWNQRCAAQFNQAVRAYVKTTQTRNARGFNALLDQDATVIFANGGVLSGKKEVAAFITGFFADPGWTQTFTKLHQHVEGCRTGFVLFDSIYSVPADHRVSPPGHRRHLHVPQRSLVGAAQPRQHRSRQLSRRRVAKWRARAVWVS